MTDFAVRTIPATVHGRYLVRDGPPERLLVGFHGYGETAEAHMAELAQIPGIERWTAVAVQALHPFYAGRTGMIVASWMTSLDRELAIDDNREYVRSVVAQLPAPMQLVVLGFSQGAAMAYRAAAGSNATGLIVLAATFRQRLSRRVRNSRRCSSAEVIGRSGTPTKSSRKT